MFRLALVVLLVAACDVGEIPGAGAGGDIAPDASGGGGGGGGGGGNMDGGGSGGGSAVPRTLQVTFTSSPTAGAVYSPSNIVAIWVENSAGQIQKTIGRWANIRKVSLVAWNAKAGTTDADAVSGATRNTHETPLAVTWDLKNRAGTEVPDGTYTIRIESADRNSTLANQNNQGTFTFVKGTAAQTQTALTGGGYSDVSIVFTP